MNEKTAVGAQRQTDKLADTNRLMETQDRCGESSMERSQQIREEKKNDEYVESLFSSKSLPNELTAQT